MAVEGTKIKEMMEGKTLEKDNIKKMYNIDVYKRQVKSG